MDCRHCSAQLTEDALFCWHCGRSQQQNEIGLTTPSLVLAETAADHAPLTPSTAAPSQSLHLSAPLSRDTAPRPPAFHAAATSWGLNANNQAPFHAASTIANAAPLTPKPPIHLSQKLRPVFAFYTRSTPVPALHALLFIVVGIVIGSLLSAPFFAYSHSAQNSKKPVTSALHPVVKSSPTSSAPVDIATFVPTQTVVPSPTLSPVVAPLPPMTYEAESPANTLGHSAAVVACVTCSGGAKVGFVGMGGVLQFNNVLANSAGSYSLTLFYGTNEPRLVYMSVNGNSPLPINCGSTGGFDTIGSQSMLVTLIAGNNTMALTNDSAWAPDIDKVVVAPAS